MDVRIPIGVLFSLIGAMLVVYGLLGATSTTVHGVNLNAAWGVVMMIFGISMLWLAHRHAARARKSAG